MRLRLASSLLAVSLALLAMSCGRRESPADAAIAARTLLLTNPAEPSSLDPHLVNAATEYDLVVAFFEGLCVTDERTARPEPAVAERWETSADGLVWTFHLRADARWSDGSPVTAHDFVSAWRRALAPALAAGNAYLLYPLRNAEAINAGRAPADALGATAVDDRTLRLTLERPTPHLAALTTLPVWFPVNLRALAAHGAPDHRTTDWTRPGRLVGNGAFVLEEWTPNARLRARKNAHYWDAARVRLDRIEWLTTDSPDADERNFRAGQVHLTAGLPAAKIAAYRAEQPALLRSDPFLQTIFLRFNTTRPPFDDARVRRALSLAIDREAIVAQALRGGQRPAGALTPPDTAGYTARAAVGLDFEAARRLLAAAGYPGGRGLPPLELQVRNDQDQPRVAEVLQAQWARELGVTLTITQLEQRTWFANQQNLAYTLSGAGWIGDFVDPVTFLDLFVTGGGNNWTGWSDPDYDALIAGAAAARDPAARLELFQRAEARLLEQAPIAPIFHGVRNFLIHPAMRGWEPSLLGQNQYKKVYLQAP